MQKVQRGQSLALWLHGIHSVTSAVVSARLSHLKSSLEARLNRYIRLQLLVMWKLLFLLVADVITSFLLIIMLFIISFNLLLGVVKVCSPQMTFSHLPGTLHVRGGIGGRTGGCSLKMLK